MSNGLIEYAFRGLQPLDSVSLAFEHVAGGPMGVPLALLRALVPLPQTVKGDLVIGMDIEMGLTPTVPPVAAPMPFLFLGKADCDLFEMAIPGASDGDDKVTVWGLPATAAGKKAAGIHVPLGTYVPITSSMSPKIEGKAKLLYGSASVDIGDHHAVRLGEMGMNCTFLGPLLTPTTRVLSLPSGAPVLTGGASVIDAGAALVALFDAVVDLVVDHFFDEDSIPYDLLKEYLKNVLAIIREAAGIAMSGEPDADEEGPAKLMEIFTVAPFEALGTVAQKFALFGYTTVGS